MKFGNNSQPPVPVLRRHRRANCRENLQGLMQGNVSDDYQLTDSNRRSIHYKTVQFKLRGAKCKTNVADPVANCQLNPMFIRCSCFYQLRSSWVLRRKKECAQKVTKKQFITSYWDWSWDRCSAGLIVQYWRSWRRIMILMSIKVS